MTTKRAFTMLPHYAGKVEEYETWRFQLIHFLSQEPYFVEFLEWIENDLGSENQHSTAVQEKNLEREALAMIKALAAGGHERDHARSDSVVSVNSRTPRIQCATYPGIGWTSFSTSTLSENV